MPTGVVKSVMEAKGFCFLRRDDGEPDVFLHIRDIDRNVAFDSTLMGKRLMFEVVIDEKRGLPRASNARAI